MNVHAAVRPSRPVAPSFVGPGYLTAEELARSPLGRKAIVTKLAQVRAVLQKDTGYDWKIREVKEESSAPTWELVGSTHSTTKVKFVGDSLVVTNPETDPRRIELGR